MRRLAVLLVLVVVAGCGQAAPPASEQTPPASEQAQACNPGPVGTREVPAGERSFVLHVPPGVTAPAPVVVSFHGRNSDAQEQLLLTAMTELANAEGFLLALPEARGGRWRFQRDAGYVDDVLAAIPCADASRRYAQGMSMGSAMVFAEACRPERRFAAFGGVAVALWADRCSDSAPAPIIYFHGTKDEVVPFGGGTPEGESRRLEAVPKVMRQWARHNDCQQVQVNRRKPDVVESDWSRCADDADVDWYRVVGGGHTWPGSPEIVANAIEPMLGKTTRTVDASELMWQFFSGYSL